jgi:hypothetical protein
VADLREALEGLIAEFGAPAELTLTVDVAWCHPSHPCPASGLPGH